MCSKVSVLRKHSTWPHANARQANVKWRNRPYHAELQTYHIIGLCRLCILIMQSTHIMQCMGLHRLCRLCKRHYRSTTIIGKVEYHDEVASSWIFWLCDVYTLKNAPNGYMTALLIKR